VTGHPGGRHPSLLFWHKKGGERKGKRGGKEKEGKGKEKEKEKKEKGKDRSKNCRRSSSVLLRITRTKLRNVA
jgi:hypothetical protein